MTKVECFVSFFFIQVYFDKTTDAIFRYLWWFMLYLKWIISKDLLYSTGNSAQCYVAAWMGEESGGKWIHVNVWLVPLLSPQNYHNAVNWLYSIQNKKLNWKNIFFPLFYNWALTGLTTLRKTLGCSTSCQPSKMLKFNILTQTFQKPQL